MSKSDEAFELAVVAIDIPMSNSYRIIAKAFWEMAIFFQKERISAIAEKVKSIAIQNGSGSDVADEIVRRIKEE